MVQVKITKPVWDYLLRLDSTYVVGEFLDLCRVLLVHLDCALLLHHLLLQVGDALLQLLNALPPLFGDLVAGFVLRVLGLLQQLVLLLLRGGQVGLVLPQVLLVFPLQLLERIQGDNSNKIAEISNVGCVKYRRNTLTNRLVKYSGKTSCSQMR